eukprot:scaffold1373_cov367-Pinguiococcus_pyrenoidosus.AAC.10
MVKGPRRAAARQKALGERAQEQLSEPAAEDVERLFSEDRSGARKASRAAKRRRDDAAPKVFSVVEQRRVQKMLERGLPAKKAEKKPEVRLEDPWAEGSAAKQAPPRVKRRRTPAVILPSPGQSSNPSLTDHQDALGEAVAAEIERVEAEKEASRPITRGYFLPGTVENDRSDSEDSLSDSDSEDEAGKAAAARRSRKERRGVLTRAERNRQRLARQRAVAQEEERRRGKKLRAVNAAGDILKDVTKKERERRLAREELKLLKQQALEEIEDPTDKAEVALSEDISSSLRQLKTIGSQVSERAKIMAARGNGVHKAKRQKRKRKMNKKIRTIVRA